MNPYKPLTSRPANGGKLITRASGDVVGPYDYTVKRDFRRDLDREVRREGYDYFWPNKAIALGQQPYPNYPNTDEPITLLHLARRPNGKTAVIAGTPTTLYRYFALENGAYIETSGDNTPYVATSGDNTPYFDDSPGEWIVIGSGFSADAQRWEAQDINGYTILNNGVDLPVTYRIEDMAVEPIYELRENGVAAVGTITEYSSILMCGDILEIHQDALDDILNPLSSGAIQSSQAGSIFSGLVTATQANGSTTVTASAATFNGGNGFVVGMVGKSLRFSNGFTSIITAVTDSTHCTVTDAPAGTDSNDGLPFYVVDLSNGSADFIVAAGSAFFTADMVGQEIIWPGIASRKIVSFTDSTHVVVDSDLTVPSGTFVVTNPLAYEPFTDQSKIDRIQYRTIWSTPDSPRDFAGVSFGSIASGSNVITLKYPVKSLVTGRQVIINGAGINGGNLTATVVLASDDLSVILDTSANTTISDTEIQAASSEGSIVGFYDIQDDGSAIIRMMPLRGTLVVYKDTSIFLGQYTGSTLGAFQFSRVYNGNSGSRSLFYKYTLIDLDGLYHIYAGKNAFYRFDLTTQVPTEFEPAELIADVFFSQATLENTNLIFAADNAVTKEIYWCFPSNSSDSALCYDYRSKPGTFSTSSAYFTAAATIKKPASGITVGPVEDWFCMGTSDGTVLRYGKTNLAPVNSGAITASQADNTVTASNAIFTVEHIGCSIQFSTGQLVNITAFTDDHTVTVGGNAHTIAATGFKIISSIYHRLGQSYSSVLQGGLVSFGDDYNEKDIMAYVLYLSQFSLNTSLLFEILGTRNAGEATAVLGSLNLTTPLTKNHIPMYFRANYFQDRITVSGINNPIEIEGRTFDPTDIDSRSAIRSN